MSHKTREKIPHKTMKKVQGFFQQATKWHSNGNLDQAKSLYEKVLSFVPNHADSLHLLGLIVADQGNHQQGLELISKAISVQPKFTAYYLNRGILYKRLHENTKAEADLKKVIEFSDNNAWHAYFHLGELCLEHKRYDDAIIAYRKSIELNPSNKISYNNLGNVYLLKEDYSNAVNFYRQALQLDRNCVEAMVNAGVALKGLGDFETAIAFFQQALTIDPNYAKAYANWGLLLLDDNRFVEAERQFKRSIELAPNEGGFYSNLGLSLQKQNQFEAARECFNKALTISPTSEQTRFNLALLQLSLGEFDEGWVNYETRFNLPEREKIEYHFKQPVWRGEPLLDETLFITVEQGLGDTIQFVRYLPFVVQFGGKIILECQSELISLLREQYPMVEVIPRWHPPSQFDYHIAIMSLPLIFKTRLNTVPFSAGYFKPMQKKELSEIISPSKFGLNVGIVWAGGKFHKNDRNRSINLELLKPLIIDNIKNINFYSLQCGEHINDLQQYDWALKIKDLSPYLTDFTATASILSQLDLLITVDTAIAHLAGAIGYKTWILLTATPDFRWLIDREDNIWYNSVRLFRQFEAGEWGAVIELVKTALARTNSDFASDN